MKNLIPLFVLLCMTCKLPGQPTWTQALDQQEHNKSYSLGGALLGDSLILPAGYLGISCPRNALFAYNFQGEKLWMLQDSLEFDRGGFFDVIMADETSVYAAGLLYHDDFSLDDHPVFSRFDKEGNPIFVTHYPEENPEEPFFFSPNSMDVSGEGNILVSSDDPINAAQLIHLNAEGEVVWYKEYPFHVNSVRFINEDAFILHANEKLYMADMQGELTDSAAFEGASLEILVANGQIYQLFDHLLITRNQQLEIQDTLFTNEVMELQRLKKFGEKLWIMGIDEEEIHFTPLEEQVPGETHSFELIVDSPDFLVAGDKIFVTGDSFSGQMAMAAYNMAEEPEEYIWPDLELLDFEISNLDYYSYDDMPVGFHFDVELQVRNNGPEPLQSFAVFSLLSGGFNCIVNFFYKKITDLDLSPGQELSISYTGLMESKPPTEDHEFCFEVLAPNSQIEPDISGNMLCKTFNTTSIPELSGKQSLSIFPNPAAGKLVVETGHAGQTLLQINDLRGKLLLEKQIPGEQPFVIDVDFLKSGLYIISILTPQGRTSRKFMKK